MTEPELILTEQGKSLILCPSFDVINQKISELTFVIRTDEGDTEILITEGNMKMIQSFLNSLL